MVTDQETTHLEALLEQDESWVLRARWVRWLERGDATDTVPIAAMDHDDRIAACAWLRQQRHVLHDTIEGGMRAPQGWIEQQPLYRGLCPDDFAVRALGRD